MVVVMKSWPATSVTIPPTSIAVYMHIGTSIIRRANIDALTEDVISSQPTVARSPVIRGEYIRGITFVNTKAAIDHSAHLHCWLATNWHISLARTT